MRLTPGAPSWPRPLELLDRRAERRTLDLLVQALRGGESRALVIHGEPGVGKTALLDYLVEHAPGCRVERIAGFPSEMELPFAAAHQLCAPFLDRLDGLPAPQRDALRTSFGLSDQPPPDRFLVGLSVLDLLSEVAETQPLLCLIDDHQWLDFASALVFSFVARRLGSESLGLIFATRVPDQHLDGLPELAIGGLPAAEAAALLDSILPGKLDPRIRDQVVAETRGNPLALVELTKEMSPSELAYGLELPGAVPLSGKIEDSFRRRVEELPEGSRRLLLLASAEPTGDPVVLWRAAQRLAIAPDSQEAASEAGLADFGERIRFRHPLARSAAYSAGSTKERQKAHQALAEVADPELDPERRVWHLAQATTGPDEGVAVELEHVADLALARGCLAAASAYLQRAVALSLDPVKRTDRAIVAAQGKIRNGAIDTAVDLLAIAQAGRVNDLQHARIDLVRAQLAHVTDRGGEAPSLLLKAAQRLESVDAVLARATYLDAFSAAIFAGRLAGPGSGVLDVAEAAASLTAQASATTSAPDLLLEGLTTGYLQHDESGLPILRAALEKFGIGMTSDEQLRWMWLACMTTIRAMDDGRWETVSTQHLRLARDAGALSELPLALNSRITVQVFAGHFAEASTLAEETDAMQRAVGSNLAPYGALALSALRGNVDMAQDLIETTVEDTTQRGEGLGITIAEWARSALLNGRGEYGEAYVAATRASSYQPDLRMLAWPTVELIEAAVRAGSPAVAESGYRRLSQLTQASGTNWALGLEARSHALVAPDDEAEDLYLESISRLGQTRQRTDLARAHLVYGEWLRRQRRRTDSREQLLIAERLCEIIGMEGFALRASRERRTTGETVSKRSRKTECPELTPQEAQVARLAREGHSNPEIGVRLFISRHTVQYHLRKVFSKLGITSRAQLEQALPPDA